ncbi:MAG: 16S rRNA (uracil(1498)-N(3))-methyltransferase [Candidatus Accumulibacter sp.]|jgi:16S rRNA (uracil1498-N3)-methyltransferase|nr:16S rRNA (uracil(1498)-N(3))-methyltransferase [Accumulibacter sp.]
MNFTRAAILPRFFCPLPLLAGLRMDIPENVARHAVKSRRMKAGDALVLFNGLGGEFAGRIAAAGSDKSERLMVEVEEKHEIERESPLAITLIQALLPGEKMDMAIQKAVELGVRRIVPVISRRSVPRLEGGRKQRRLEHWRGIVISACEQCGRNRLLEIDTPQDLASYLGSLDPAPDMGTRRILLPDADTRLLEHLPTLGRIDLLIGAEGGFDPEEIRLARAKDFFPSRLGQRILRTETAGIAAVAAIQSLWGDF